MTLIECLLTMTESQPLARRLLAQGAVKVGLLTITQEQHPLLPGDIVRVGNTVVFTLSGGLLS